MKKDKRGKVIIWVILIVVCVAGALIYCTTRKTQNSDNLENDIHNVDKMDDIEESKENVSQDSSESKDKELNLDYKKQLDLILNNKTMWYKDTEFDKYSYAVTDLDKNGRLEIISSICQGTGMYTYTEIYEVTENIDGLKLCESDLMEYDSQADIIKNNWKVFYDNANEKYHYVFDDLTKNGAAEYYENKRDFCLSDGKIAERYLAYKETIYQGDTPAVTYTDLNDVVISEEEYNNYEEKFFEGYEKMMVNIEWLSNLEEMGTEDLKNSYDKFEIYLEK